MNKLFLGLARATFFVTLAFGLNAYAADACSEKGGHSGNGTTTRGQNNSSVTGNIGSSGYHYEIWYQGGNNSMTYYNDGTFSAEWNGSNDFLARVGLKYNSTQTHDQIGYFTADYKFTKSGSAAYSYIGIYGWTENPLVEYYIVDDWFTKPSPQYLGTKKGEITVDGDTYDIYTFTRVNQPSIKGTSTFPQFFSVRRNARQCGHIDITAHFKKWGEVGLNLGKMYEVKVLAEAGGGATGKIDFTYFNITSKGSPSGSETAVTPKSSASTHHSSTSIHPSSSSHRSSHLVSSSSRTGSHHGSSSSKAKVSSSSRDFWGSVVASSSSITILSPISSSSVAPVIIPISSSSGNIIGSIDALPDVSPVPMGTSVLQVFDVQGKYLGKVEFRDGTSLNDAVFMKFGKAGVYMVKRDGKVKMLSVTR